MTRILFILRPSIQKPRANMTRQFPADLPIKPVQNFEAVIQYQFDFGLRPSLGYVLSKAKILRAGSVIW
ncbi:porin [Salmonella enterica subsp. enterica]|nr:porin [Salmonella enterica subsp. enterica]